MHYAQPTNTVKTLKPQTNPQQLEVMEFGPGPNHT